jgi:hypothetical protein
MQSSWRMGSLRVGRASPDRRTSWRRPLVWVGALAVTASAALAPVAIGAGPAGAAGTATAVTTCNAQSPSVLLPGGEPSLTAGGCLISPNQQYELIMQSDGNLVLYYQTSSNPLWSSATPGNPGAFFRLQGNGYMAVINSTNVTQLWPTGSDPWVGTANPELVLQDDGNLVLYSVSGATTTAVWSTGTTGLRTRVTSCNAQSPSTVNGGSSIASGGCLASSDQQYAVEMQADGNLVVYYQPFSAQPQPLWDSNTAANPGATASVQTDGNLVVYSATGVALWSSNTTGTPNSYLSMQADGNAVVYGNSFAQQSGTTTGNGYAAWSTQTNDLRGYQLHSGQVLEPGQYLKSPNGQFGLTMGQQGVLVLYNTGLTTGGYSCPIWAVPAVTGVSSTGVSYAFTNLPGAYLQVTTPGDLALWRPGGPSTGPSMWDAGTSGSGNYATVQNDGNFVIYNSVGTALWSSNTAATDSNHGWAMCSGSTLQAGQSIYSVSGGYSLTMQSDCNLVLYSSSGTATWASNTDVNQSKDFTKSKDDSTLYGDTPPPAENYSGCYAELQASGYLVIIAPNTTGSGYGGPHQLWSYEFNNLAPQIQMPLNSFGPYVVYADSSGQLKIDNAAGVALATNPAIDISTKSDLSSSGTGQDIGNEIKGFMVSLFFTLLFL